MGRGGNRLSLEADGVPGPPFLSLQEGPQPPLGLGYCCDTLEPGCSLLTLPAPSSCVVLIGWGVARKEEPMHPRQVRAGVDTVASGTLSRKRGTATSGPPGTGARTTLCVPRRPAFPAPPPICSHSGGRSCHPLAAAASCLLLHHPTSRAHHQLPVVDSFCVCSHPFSSLASQALAPAKGGWPVWCPSIGALTSARGPLPSHPTAQPSSPGATLQAGPIPSFHQLQQPPIQFQNNADHSSNYMRSRVCGFWLLS